MATVRVLLVAGCALLLASGAQTAPAPVAKPPRHVPSPASLLQGFLAEGFDLCALERGQEPGLYRLLVATTPRTGRQLYVTYEAFEVRVSGDVRAELRAFLVRKRPATSQWELDGFIW
jgi:hypothetical protein